MYIQCKQFSGTKEWILIMSTFTFQKTSLDNFGSDIIACLGDFLNFLFILAILPYFPCCKTLVVLIINWAITNKVSGLHFCPPALRRQCTPVSDTVQGLHFSLLDKTQGCLIPQEGHRSLEQLKKLSALGEQVLCTVNT